MAERPYALLYGCRRRLVHTQTRTERTGHPPIIPRNGRPDGGVLFQVKAKKSVFGRVMAAAIGRAASSQGAGAVSAHWGEGAIGDPKRT